jgi:hypothetical protein
MTQSLLTKMEPIKTDAIIFNQNKKSFVFGECLAFWKKCAPITKNLFFQEVTEIVTVDVAVSNNSFQYALYHITRV